MTTHNDMLDIAALRALLDATTEGPWEVSPCSNGGALLKRGRDVGLSRHEQSSLQVCPATDAQLIAAMRNALPALLDRLERAERVVGAAQNLAASVDDYGWSSDRMDECRLYSNGRVICDRLEDLFAALTPTPEQP